MGNNASPSEKFWYLYVLECTGERLYTGISTDPAARYAAHSSGRGARFTRSFPPLRLLYVEVQQDRSAALKAEYAFKQLSAEQKWQYITRQQQARPQQEVTTHDG